jgi:hypothetical protein
VRVGGAAAGDRHALLSGDGLTGPSTEGGCGSAPRPSARRRTLRRDRAHVVELRGTHNRGNHRGADRLGDRPSLRGGSCVRRRATGGATVSGPPRLASLIAEGSVGHEEPDAKGVSTRALVLVLAISGLGGQTTTPAASRAGVGSITGRVLYRGRVPPPLARRGNANFRSATFDDEGKLLVTEAFMGPTGVQVWDARTGDHLTNINASIPNKPVDDRW